MSIPELDDIHSIAKRASGRIGSRQTLQPYGLQGGGVTIDGRLMLALIEAVDAADRSFTDAGGREALDDAVRRVRLLAGDSGRESS
jgi:hypothetical protein